MDGRKHHNMSLRIIAGPPGTGKTRFCAMDIAQKQQLQEDCNQLFIVPEQFTLQGERELIHYSPSDGIMKAQVLSFGRLAYYILAQQGGRRQRLLTDVGKTMILRKIICDHPNEFLFLQGCIDRPGFMEQTSTTLTELFQYEILPQTLSFLDTQGDLLFAQKVLDLSQLQQYYEEYLEQEYLSADTVLDLLSERIAASPLIQNAEIWLDGFKGFTPQEQKVLEKLMQAAKRVTITLCIDQSSLEQPEKNGIGLFYETSQTAMELFQLALHAGVLVESPVYLDHCRFLTNGLQHIHTKFSFYGGSSSLSHDGVSVIQSTSLEEEVETSARMIRRLVMDQGYRYREIAIVTRALEKYEPYLRIFFQEYEIPYFIDQKKDILCSPLTELIRSAMDIAAFHFSHESVFSYLKTGLTDVSREEVDGIENYCLANGIQGAKWYTPWCLGFSSEEEKGKLNGLRELVSLPLVQFQSSITAKEKSTVKEISEALCQLLEQIGIRKKWEACIQTLEEEGKREQSAEQKQTFVLLMELLNQMVELLGSQKVGVLEYKKIFDSGLNQCQLGMIPPGLDRVIIGDVERTRLPNCRALWILGGNEGVFPAPMEENGIFTEQERKKIVEQGVILAPDSKRRMLEEQFYAYCALTKPSERLYVSFAIRDLEGHGMYPSILIRSLQRLFPKMKLQRAPGGFSYSTKKTAFRLLGQALRGFTDRGGILPEYKDLYSYFYETHPQNIAALLSGVCEPKQEKLSSPLAHQLYGEPFFISVSKLETFQSCPFQFFIKEGLKAEKREQYQLDFSDWGYLVHAMLEKISKDLASNTRTFRDLSSEEIPQIVATAAKDIATSFRNQLLFAKGSYQFQLERIIRMVSNAVHAMAQQMKGSGFHPFGYEIKFGEGEPIGPLVISLDQGEMVLRGKIDRIDLLKSAEADYAVIIDYKTGRQAFSLINAYYGLQLQLLLYMKVILSNNKNEHRFLPAAVWNVPVLDTYLHSKKPLSPMQIEKEQLKKFKFSGLLLKDRDIIEKMDDQLMQEKSSLFLPAAFTAKGEFHQKSCVAEQNQYNKLIDFAVYHAKCIGERIQNGRIDAKPYEKDKQLPCEYCSYHSICRFDSKLDPCRHVIPIKQEQIWELIEKRVREKEDL